MGAPGRGGEPVAGGPPVRRLISAGLSNRGVLHYLRDWGPALAELRRGLAPGGALLFSRPTIHRRRRRDWPRGGRDDGPPTAVDYFAGEPVEAVWRWLGPVRFWRRPLSAVVDALADAGFVVERLVEPRPTAAFRDAMPESSARRLRRPEFLLIRARVGGARERGSGPFATIRREDARLPPMPGELRCLPCRLTCPFTAAPVANPPRA